MALEEPSTSADVSVASERHRDRVRRAPVSAPARPVAVLSCVHRWNDTRILVKQAASLAEHGREVILVGIGDRPAPFEHLGVRVIQLPRRRRPLRWITWLSILQIVRQQQPSVVHVHDPELIPLALLLKLAGRRAICDIHENVAEQVLEKEWLPVIVRRPLGLVLKVVLRWLPRAADAVILAEDSYLKHIPRASNVSVIHNYPLLPAQYKENYESDVLRLVYVGDVRLVRGIREYVTITHRLNARGIPTELTVIGSFANPEEGRQIADLVRELSLERQVKLLGRRPPEDLPTLLQNCDVGLALLHPIGNFRESYPTKMFEYMAAGLPAVASRFALWENVLVSNECGRVVNPLDVDEATSVLEEYWKSPDLRERHGRNGRRAVVERYHWGLDVPRLLAIYDGVGA